MTGEAFRRLALDMDGVVEGAHMGHPDFRANGRIFAGLHANEESGTLKLTPDEQQALIHEHPDVFAPAAGAWGRQGWTVVQLDRASAASVRGALMLALQNIISLPPKRPAAKRARSKAGSARRRRA